MDLKLLETFKSISRIPRESGNEQQISDYLAEFARRRGLLCRQDECLNVIIEKPAGKGYEKAEGIFLQAHMDMVCVKTPASTHDFICDGIDIIENDGVISARDTSLGADNGIGVAMILHLLDDCQNHPAIVAVFTVDEERGLLGVKNIDLTPYAGIQRMVNLDGEEEGVFLTSCAGGMRYTLEIPIIWQELAGVGFEQLEIRLEGLNGGHSGLNIHKNYANAILVMARILNDLSSAHEITLLELAGGSKENSIPADAKAVIAIRAESLPMVQSRLKQLLNDIKKEYFDTEPNLRFAVEKNSQRYPAGIQPDSMQPLLDLLLLLPNGLFKSNKSGEMAVSSANIGVVRLMDDKAVIASLIRSNIDSYKYYIASLYRKTAELFGAAIHQSSDYPAWEYREQSEIRAHFNEIYCDMFGSKPAEHSVHGGLECAYFAEKIQDIDMISIGCDISDVHSVDEKLDMHSATRVYRFLKQAIAAMK